MVPGSRTEKTFYYYLLSFYLQNDGKKITMEKGMKGLGTIKHFLSVNSFVIMGIP